MAEASKEVVSVTTAQIAQMTSANAKTLAELSARYNGSRNSQKVEEFISRTTIFKDINNITDANALNALPLLLECEAST